MENNIYMVDTNHWLGSWQEGTCQLHTLSEDGQLITWRATAVSPDNQVNITGFSGCMVEESICTPLLSGGDQWEGRVETRGLSGRYSYDITLAVDGSVFRCSPYLDVQ